MPEEKTDQSQETGKSEITGLDSVWGSDFFQHGLESFDEVKKETKPAKTEEECPECEKEKKAKEAAESITKEKQIYPKTLKVAGKEIVVNSKKELAEKIAEFYDDDSKIVDIGQMSADYTRKNQARAEKEKIFEGQKDEFSTTIKKFNDLVERLNSGTTEKARQEIKEPEVIQEKTIEEEYGIDPELADPWAVKMANDIRGLRSKNDQLEKTTQLFLLDKVVGTMKEAIGATEKEFPIVDIKDEKGKSLTQSQFIAILRSKLESPENRNSPLPELAREAVKELHMSQKIMTDATTEQVKGEAISEDISPEEFKVKYPKLFGKLSDHGVAEYLATKESTPPTLKSKGAEVDVKAKSGVKGDGSIRDYLDAAFEDEEILSNIRTG